MEYRNLRRTGVQVSALCLGGMLFGEQTDEAEALKIIDRALDVGLNFLELTAGGRDPCKGPLRQGEEGNS
jgi:aryl-alcohol dehydrogenase-like predicted oxidoreductase